MTSARWLFRLRQISRRIWFRATLFSVGGVATALLAVLAGPFIPPELPTQIGADAVDNILGIIASSMLTVTTFSLSTMVSAYSAATSNVTPRATRLVMEDSTTQNVLATFVGSFLFSLVGIIALSTGLYGDRGRVVLFAVTILMIVLIVTTLLRWIDHLSRLGRVTETTERVEAAALAALLERARDPALGGSPLRDERRDVPAGARPLDTEVIGYVQHVDVPALVHVAEKTGGRVFVLAAPGAFVDPTRPLAWLDGAFDEAALAAVRAAFTLGPRRSFDQDPRFGAAVLTEIASRALSPATNDIGTAIDVIGRTVRLLALYARASAEAENGAADGGDAPSAAVFVPPLDLGDLFDDIFMPIARDGAVVVEVGIRLQKAFATIAALDPRFAPHARRHSARALAYAEEALAVDADREALRVLARAVEAGGPAR